MRYAFALEIDVFRSGPDRELVVSRDGLRLIAVNVTRGTPEEVDAVVMLVKGMMAESLREGIRAAIDDAGSGWDGRE